MNFEIDKVMTTKNDTKLDRSVLHLTLKREWFDMIACGEKREEYRELKDYWIRRLSGRRYDLIQFRNGYNKGCPEMLVECLGIEVGYGKPRWGCGSAECFKIKLGRVIRPPAGSRWEWVEREFTEKEVCDEDYVPWIWKHVRIGPFSKKLNLRDGEVVRTTPLHNGGMKVEIRFENKKNTNADGNGE